MPPVRRSTRASSGRRSDPRRGARVSAGGISILTTNKPENIDEAFKRRLRFDIEFPLPDAAQRCQLWKSMIPPECRLAGRIRFEQLAARYEMGGGSIQNAVLRAAFLAAETGSPVTEELLFRAANEEYHVLGRLA